MWCSVTGWCHAELYQLSKIFLHNVFHSKMFLFSGVIANHVTSHTVTRQSRALLTRPVSLSLCGSSGKKQNFTTFGPSWKNPFSDHCKNPLSTPLEGSFRRPGYISPIGVYRVWRVAPVTENLCSRQIHLSFTRQKTEGPPAKPCRPQFCNTNFQSERTRKSENIAALIITQD